METPIGRSFAARRGARLAAAAAAVVVVALDMLVWRHPWARAALAAAAVLVHAALARGHRDSLGLRLRPIQGVGYWIKATAAMALAIGAFIAAVVAVSWYADRLVVYWMEPRHAWRFFLNACLYAPLVEEAVYRLAVCAPACAVLGPWGAVVVSGAAFAALHFVYGNPGPDNFIAGFFLAWAYLRSGSIAVPVVLHFLGNLFVGAALVATYYAVAATAS